MTNRSRALIIALSAGLLLCTAAAAQRMPVDISSDSTHGKMLRVYYSKVADQVTIETSPDVHFVCQSGSTTECYAYLKPGSTVTVRVWRKPARLLLGASPKGIPAQGHQWREDCLGAGEFCTVTLDTARSIGVNWLAQP